MATYVLIPGAGGDAWEWHLLALELEGRGHEVASPCGCPRVTKRRLERVRRCGRRGDRRTARHRARRPVARRLHRAARRRAGAGRSIVLLNAMIPLPGETGNALVGKHPTEGGRAGLLRECRPDRRDRRRRGRRLLPRCAAATSSRRHANHDPGAVDDADGTAVAARLLAGRPDPRLIGRDDRLFPAAFQLPGRKGAPRDSMAM